MELDIWVDRTPAEDQPYQICTVICKKKKTKEAMLEEIRELWANFSNAHPEWDGEFVDQLRKNGYDILPCRERIVLR